MCAARQACGRSRRSDRGRQNCGPRRGGAGQRQLWSAVTDVALPKSGWRAFDAFSEDQAGNQIRACRLRSSLAAREMEERSPDLAALAPCRPSRAACAKPAAHLRQSGLRLPAGCICYAAARRRSLRALELLGGLHPARVQAAVWREMEGAAAVEQVSPSDSAGLLMLEKDGSPRASCGRRSTRRRGRARPAGSLAGAPAGGQRTTVTRPLIAMELSGAAGAISRCGGAYPAGSAAVRRRLWRTAACVWLPESCSISVLKSGGPGAGPGHRAHDRVAVESGW